MKLAAEAAGDPQPDQDVLNALACMEEHLRTAQNAVGQNALFVSLLKGDKQ